MDSNLKRFHSYLLMKAMKSSVQKWTDQFRSMRTDLVVSLILILIFPTNGIADELTSAGLNLKAIQLRTYSNQIAASAVAAASNPTVAATLSDAASAIGAAATLTDQASAEAAAKSGDNNDWTGDHLQIFGNMSNVTKDGSPSTCYFAPAYTKFDIASEKNGTVYVSPRENICYADEDNCTKDVKKANGQYKATGVSGRWLWGYLYPPNYFVSVEGAVPTGCTLISPYDTYAISKVSFDTVPYERYGLTFGALIVPFKYQLKAKVLSSSPSFQLYMGFKQETNGFSQGPFISTGISTEDVPTGTGSSTSKQGFSYGIGWIFDIKKGSGMQLMVILGQDRFGANSGYPYEGGSWASTSIGVGF